MSAGRRPSAGLSSGIGRGGWLALILALGGCGVADEQLTLVTPRLEIDRALAQGFAEVFDQPGAPRIELVANPDPDRPGLAVVLAGEADLALVANSEPYDERLAAVAPLYPTVLHIAYRYDAGAVPVTDVVTLLGSSSVYAGPPGSPSRGLLETAARREGIEQAQIRYVEDGSCADVIVVYAAVLPGIESRFAECGNYRMFSLGRPEEIGTGSFIDGITLVNPYLKPFVIPAETYGSLTPGPVVTLAVDKLLVARREVPETAIYDLLDELLRQKPALSAAYPGLFHQLTENFDVSGSAFVVHPGARAYLKRDEPNIYERYSGIAEVAVTVLIGLISGIYGAVKIWSIRRKNRIDAFCREALEIRDRAAGGDAGSRARALEALKALRDRAYDDLIHEQLSADESFRIFITLTEDVAGEIRVAE